LIDDYRPDDGGIKNTETPVNFYDTTRRNILEEIILTNHIFTIIEKCKKKKAAK
jgi:hypothetical protein